MTWITAILAGIKALPKLLDLIKSIGDAYAQMDLDKDIREIQEAHDQFTSAQNFTQRLAAARRIAMLGKRL